VVVSHIKSFSKKPWSFTAIKEKSIKLFHDNNVVLGECALINVRRTFYLSIIAIPLRIIAILMFTFTVAYDTLSLKAWRQGIIVSHFVLLIFMIGFFITTRKLKNKKEPTSAMFILQYLVVIVIMASGIVIVTFDQLVTTNITPFLLISVISGTVFLIRPLISFTIYLTSYIAYYFLLALTITNQELLLSNRVNGISAVGIGFLLSITLWNYNFTNITQKWCIESQQKQLEQMAYYDSLTGLSNRRFFNRLLKQEISSMERHGHESVIIILDIDNFKSINDTYGHPVGDNVLKQLATLLEKNVRDSDIVSRFGGEEFVILMPKSSLEEGYAFAERLRKLIMEKRFTVNSITVQITSSFGVSLLSNIKSQDLADYYSHADKALYLAKQSGKNKVSCHPDKGA
jgi:diguanylate cyclase (GGDEF)-like protein